MKFRVTPHSGSSASRRPADSLDLLWQQLGADREGVSFAKVGAEIVATWPEDVPESMDQDVRAQVGRRAVFEILRGVCEGKPELNLDWFAVGFFD